MNRTLRTVPLVAVDLLCMKTNGLGANFSFVFYFFLIMFLRSGSDIYLKTRLTESLS